MPCGFSSHALDHMYKQRAKTVLSYPMGVRLEKASTLHVGASQSYLSIGRDPKRNCLFWSTQKYQNIWQLPSATCKARFLLGHRYEQEGNTHHRNREAVGSLISPCHISKTMLVSQVPVARECARLVSTTAEWQGKTHQTSCERCWKISSASGHLILGQALGLSKDWVIASVRSQYAKFSAQPSSVSAALPQNTRSSLERCQ
jgi:hypothetical protein